MTDSIQVYESADGLRWFSGSRVTVNGIQSTRENGPEVARHMIGLFDDGDGLCSAKWRWDPNEEVDADHWVRTGEYTRKGRANG